ncbi:RNA pseudouridine synthase [Aliifodinibius salipaludis]|uniref:Pseudouridine synthase n=1 Tax=Fodinibius salipaludis TaxID=2032627 RepID=A0A2A2GBG5_9BACT|nr:RluA family pseudouridine synthase [Aliifodinibius salipaludis]PAU94213.1 RNA pseudouridine synthase [Aliifodinibius salipaludis]
MSNNNRNQFQEYHLEVPQEETSGTRLDKYLASKIEETSRTKIQEAIKDGHITVNEKKEKASYNIEPDDIIDVQIPTPTPPDITAEEIPLDIVYEDDDLLLVNKSANMVVHPAKGNWSGTLVNGLMWHTDELSEPEEDTVRPGIVHRLDKDTSGLLVVAKNDKAHRILSEYFRTKEIERTYWAIVWGTPDEKEGTITGAIGRDPHNRKRMAVVPEDKGKHATTHYKVLEYFDHLTLLELKLETGRTHQIRVHLADNNLWGFGDQKYGGDSVRYGPNTGSRKQMFQNLFASLQRQCLHAKTLGFEHPTTGEIVEFNSELPGDFQQVLGMLRQNCKPNHIY